jgi:hypothetical protein
MDVNRLLSEAIGGLDPERVLSWLLGTQQGNLALREAIYSRQGQEIVWELLGRDTIHVLVKVHGDGWVEVMADDRRVRAEIIDLPPSRTDDDLVDALADLMVRPCFRDANKWPTNRKAARMVRLRSTMVWCQEEEQRDADLAVLEAADRAGDQIRKAIDELPY